MSAAVNAAYFECRHSGLCGTLWMDCAGAVGVSSPANYRSWSGNGALVTEPAKTEALRLFTEHIMKGRWAQIRQPNEQELKGTTVPRWLEEVSAKVRTGIL
jgi:nitroimidazol reductase NimA-like FMN-containing flavoprotein (pyridoxamine 5'-phosphate oxidase superfamily)